MERKFNTAFGLVDHIYSDKTIFTLLFSCAVGSSYDNFRKKIVDLEVDDTFKFIDNLSEYERKAIELSKQTIYILADAQTHAIFDVVYQDITIDEAKKEISNVMKFFMQGWSKIFGF